MKIGIVGAGHVGCSTAYGLLLRGVGSSIVLYDLNKARATSEAEDLNHAAPFSYPITVTAASSYSSLSNCGIIILSCGVSQKPGEPRIALLDRNALVFKSVVPQVIKYAPGAIIIVATNPVDVMTLVATRLAGLGKGRVFGSGTVLDTARFETFLGLHLGISSQSVDAFVMGEHGDSKVCHWSGASGGGIPVRDLGELLERRLGLEDRRRIDGLVRNAANRIIEGKGSTYYGIGAALTRICEAIVNDQREIFTVTMMVDGRDGGGLGEGIEGTAVSLPRIVGASGVEATLRPDLTPGELQALEESAGIIRKATDAMEMDLDQEVLLLSMANGEMDGEGRNSKMDNEGRNGDKQGDTNKKDDDDWERTEKAVQPNCA